MTTNDIERTKIVVTGLAWMGHGICSIDSTIEKMFEEAHNEIQVAAYTITASASRFIQLLSNSLSRGIQVTLILNRFVTQPKNTQKAIVQLAKNFKHFSLFEFNPKNKLEDLHAKLIVVDHRKALVGSSNISWKGLYINHELAVVLEGQTAREVGCLIDILTRDTRTKPIVIR